MDPEWSETGDRYLLKLFRDYLFHQVTETGSAWIDFAHIVSVLNKVTLNYCLFNFLNFFLVSGSPVYFHTFFKQKCNYLCF